MTNDLQCEEESSDDRAATAAWVPALRRRRPSAGAATAPAWVPTLRAATVDPAVVLRRE